MVKKHIRLICKQQALPMKAEKFIPLSQTKQEMVTVISQILESLGLPHERWDEKFLYL